MKDRILGLLIGPVSSRLLIAFAASAGTALLTFQPEAFSAFCSGGQ